VAVGATGPATVETYTVTYDYGGTPQAGYVAALLDDDTRAFAVTRDRDLVAGLLERDPIGNPIRLLDGARFDLS
jgi:hypothetical protein